MASSDRAQSVEGQATSAGEDAPPSHDDLAGALAKVRRRGIGNLCKPPLLDLAPLLWIARLVSTKEDDASKIEDTLEHAARRLGGMSAEAVLALLGLTPETRGQYVDFRRKAAAERYDYKTPESFRAHYEKQLLLALATQLLIFVDTQRLHEDQQRLAQSQERHIEALRRLRQHQDDLIESQKHLVASLERERAEKEQQLKAMREDRLQRQS